MISVHAPRKVERKKPGLKKACKHHTAKTLINTIHQRFSHSKAYLLWVDVFRVFLKSLLKVHLFLPYCFRDFEANSPTAIGITLEVLT